jgi:hypothetical protein
VEGHLLESAHAKLDRAGEHLKTLDTDWQATVKAQAYGVVVRTYLYPGSYRASFTIDRPHRLHWSILVGELVHNMRSALDHLTARLMEKQGGNLTKQTAFPIHEHESEFVAKVLKPAQRGKRGPLTGFVVGGPEWAFIEDLQPYKPGQGGRNSALYTINDLWNRDKHRMLNPIFLDPPVNNGLDFIGWNPLARLTKGEPLWYQGEPLQDGTELAHVVFNPTGPDPQVHVKDRIPLRISFGEDDGGTRAFADSLKDFRQIVRDAEAKFFP